MGEGGGREEEEEEVAAGLKAAVSWQLGQALVSVIQPAAATIDPATGLRALLLAPDGFFPVPALLASPPRPPLLLPFPPLPRGAWGQPSAVTLPETLWSRLGTIPFSFLQPNPGGPRGARSDRRSPPGEVSEGRLGVLERPGPQRVRSARGRRSGEAPAGLRGPPGAPRLRGGQSGRPRRPRGVSPWCSGVRDVEDVEEEEALAQQGAGVRGVLGRGPGRLGR